MQTIKETIQIIEQELSRLVMDYVSWFELHPDLLNYKPKEGWSIGQILEHVTLVNHFLLILIRKGKEKAKALATKTDDLEQAVSIDECNLSKLKQIEEHGSFTWIRPEHMEPTGNKTIVEIKKLLKEQINECKEILKEIPNGEGTLYKTKMSVNNLGKIDVYQYIYFLCQHAKRHITQMQIIKEEKTQ